MSVVDFRNAGVSNTPARITRSNGLRVLVDWVTASFHSEKNFFEIQELFSLTELVINGQKEPIVFEEIHGARYKYAGYTITYRYSNIEFMYAPDEGKYLLNMTGQGCREFEQISVLDYEMLFGMLIGQLSANVSRIDIAIDDFNCIYKVNTIRKAVQSGQAVTHIRTWGTHQRGNVGGHDLTMDNFYLGTLKSRYSINVYDKKMEQEAKNKEVTVPHWTRTELRLKEEYATRFARIIALSTGNDNLGQYVMSFLNNSITFVKKKSLSFDTNRTRIAENQDNWTHWWKKYLGEVGKLSLSQKAPDKSVERTVNWFLTQIVPSMAVLEEVDPEGYGYFIRELTNLGKDRLNNEHLLLIEEAQKNSLTLAEVLDRLNK
ncbi:replication initiation factor domain-containing protein [Lysinibacillus xylanilyticus]|uniref:Uncharacterized protein n=1 Tax=Lysinibacillus xylanilyticus TaxID=582475 RepID=A0A2M9PXI3_9BACI|nr:replication initiation factor domain-containing protein [Lysinibacillus xylanilyticus]PJO40548.1 hypothetical protein CWD94_27575 [Lysinibacillus xylanilyticus]